MNFAFVTTNLLDMWARPEYNSERVNQLFWGTVVTTSSSRQGFLFARNPDGYRGWIDQRFLKEISQRKARSYMQSLNGVVCAMQSNLRDSAGTSANPHLLYWGNPVRIRSRRGSRTIIVLPDESRFAMRSGAVALTRAFRPTGADLVNEAKKLLGVPYLWGGITASGLDCSGLIQTVCARFGIAIARDTKDQVKAGIRVERDQVRRGDLLFFKRHVGLAMGRNKIIHSSVGGGGVRINSLRPDRPDYRGDLDRNFATARRIL